MNLFTYACPECGSEDVCADHQYKTKNYGVRTIYHCRKCDIYFSETFGRPIAGLTTALSRIIEILKARHWFRPMRSRKSYSARSVGICCQSWLTWFLSKKCLYTLFLC